MQLYRGMDIGTAKLTVEPSAGASRTTCSTSGTSRRTASVAEYQELARRGHRRHRRRAAGSRCWSAAPASTSGPRSATSSSPAPTTRSATRLEAELASDGPRGALPATAGRRPRSRRPRSCRATAAGSSARWRSSSCPAARSARPCPATTPAAPPSRSASQRRPRRARPADRGPGRPHVGGRLRGGGARRWPPSACVTARPPPAPSATSRCSAPRRRVDRRAGPRRDRPRDPPLRPPPGILVQARPARHLARVRRRT